MLSCLVPGAWPSTGSVTTRLMIWVVVAVNLCVRDKCRIVPFTERLCRCLGPNRCRLPLAAEPALLPEVKPALETSVVLGEGWRGHSDACYRRACAAPVLHLQALLNFHKSATLQLDPHGAVGLAVAWSTSGSVLGLPFHVFMPGQYKGGRVVKVFFPHS